MQGQSIRCELCNDTGFIFKVINGVEYAEACQCIPIKRAAKLAERSGISATLQERMAFDEYHTGCNRILMDAKQTAIRYVERFRQYEQDCNNSILFCGQVGAGKTHLGVAISTALMKQGIQVVYMVYRDVMTYLKQNIMDEKNYLRAMEPYKIAQVLFIDDLLKGNVSKSDINILYEIINYRYLKQLPMIIGTEKTIAELQGFDEAIGSRIIEMSRGNIIMFSGKDLNYRLRLKE